ncbi:MAG TPA: MBL fold metallo-hydrolase [Vicinamibacterales bacterium]|jgi:phosphoribosyl 1,2-cyclic phosphate phosphodiesterase|nr:MBL fold metallo-hydrolase [Vicinamibacterales bacterium]
MRVTVLGSGTSHGVPSIGCDCAVCRSSDPRDRRLRPSILIELSNGAAAPFASGVRSILVDTSTDLREQAIRSGVRRVDAILFTHSHADHVMGIDDVRRYNQMQKEAIPCYADEATLRSLRQMFAYIFDPPKQVGGGLPQLSLFRIGGPFVLGGSEIVPVPLMHGSLPVLGFRIGGFAYLTDCNRIPDDSWPLLTGVRVVILDALRHRPHSTHFSVGESIAIAEKIGVERAYFTHICHDLPHAATNASLPAGVELAYDGLTLEIA